MSGHSKWSTIKRKKGATDAARGKLFTRLIREISISAKEGGGDVNANPRLRTAVAAAKAGNMPNDNISRAIKKGTGELEGFIPEEMLYEGYGPYGVAVLAEVLSDNRNRSGGEIRHIFTKFGGNLGDVAWMFERKGVINIPRSGVEEEPLLEAALEAGAEDVDTEDSESYSVICEPSEFQGVIAGLEAKGITGEPSLDRIPKTTKELNADEAEKFLKFYEMLEDQDDVQRVFANFEIPDEILEKLGG